MVKSAWRSIFLVGTFLPALLPLGLILSYGVNIPFQDQWHPGVAGLFIKAHQGQLTLGDLFMQQNEHRIVMPRLVILLLGWISHWNTIWEMYAVWLIACGMSLGLLWLYRLSWRSTATDESGSPMTLGGVLICLICNLLIFSTAGWENWLWGMGLQFVMPPAFLVGALVSIARDPNRWPNVVVAALFCTAATFSAGNGLLAWPLLLLVLAWSGSWQEFRSKKWILIASLAGFAISAILYFVHYQFEPHPAGQGGPPGLLKQFQYALVFLGGPLAEFPGTDPVLPATIVGAVLFLLFLVILGYFFWSWMRKRDELCRRMLPWLALAGFSIVSSILVGAFRTYLPPLLAMSSRYRPYEIFVPISLVVLVPMVWQDIWLRHVCGRVGGEAGPHRGVVILWNLVPLAFGLVLILLWALGVPVAIDNAREERLARLYWKGHVLLSKVLPDNPGFLRSVRSDHGPVLQTIGQIDALGYLNPAVIQSANADLLKVAPRGMIIGAIDNVLRDQRGAVSATGWAYFPATREAARCVLVTCQNERGQPIIVAMMDKGMQRADLVQRENNPDLLRCGWSATLPLDHLPKELKSIRLGAWALDVETGKASQLQGELELLRQ